MAEKSCGITDLNTFMMPEQRSLTVRLLLHRLTVPEQEVLKLRLGLGLGDTALPWQTLNATGALCGITGERAAELERSAQRKLWEAD